MFLVGRLPKRTTCSSSNNNMSNLNQDPRAVHAVAIRNHTTDRCFFNNLITLYSKSRRHLSYTHPVFLLHISSPNVVSWTALISSHSTAIFSFHHFISMLRYPTVPNQRTLASLFKTCVSLSALSFGTQLHTLSFKLSLSSQPFCGSALVNFYSKFKQPVCARRVFDDITEKDDVCFSSVIVALAQNFKSFDAISMFAQMKCCNVKSTATSISAALRAASEVAALEQCQILHCHSVVTGFDLDVFVGTSLIDVYGKSGVVRDARRVFDELVGVLNIVGWNAMLSSYAQHGDKISTIELFHLMKKRGFVPDDYSFLAILSSLSNACLVDETEQWLNRMKIEYGLEPGLEHYTCLIRAMGQAGRLDEAERVAMTMPFEPDAAVWRTLLSVCAYHGAADMAWRMSQRLIEINRFDDSAYVIAANAFSSGGRWENALEVRKMMRHGGVKKEAGKSWIEVKGKVHAFFARDREHEFADKIYETLNELMEKIEKIGYVPVLDDMVHGVGEKEKREVLRYHSEKLALAFAMLDGGVPVGKTIRIVKNVRICRDCHEAFKYASLAVEREIIVRDAHRYHRFFNGSCSCGGHW